MLVVVCGVAGSRIGAFFARQEAKMPKAPRGLDMGLVEEEEESQETDETAVASHHMYTV